MAEDPGSGGQGGGQAPIRRMLGEVRAVRGAAALALAGLAVFLSLSLSRPWVLGRATRALEEAHRAGTAAGEGIPRVALVHAGIYLAVCAAMNAARFGYGYARGRMVHGILTRLRRAAHDRLHALSPTFYARFDSGAILARVSRDIEKLRPAFGLAGFSAIEMSLVVAGGVALQMAWSVPLGLATLGLFLASLAMVLTTARRLGSLTRAADDVYDGVALDIKENIEGVRVVKAFGREPRQRARFQGKIGEHLARSIDAADWWTLRMPHGQAVFGLALPTILLLGGWLRARGMAGTDAIVACIFYTGPMFRELNSLHRVVHMLQEARVSAARLYELLDAPGTVPEDPAPASLPAQGGGVSFEGVRFAYPGTDRTLRDVSFAIRPGERVALVGPTGSGKSTVTALLLRFFDPEAGRVLLDGVDVRRLPLADLRRAVGCVFQESFLFSATLRENLAFAAPGAPDERILEAARRAQLGGFVASLPHGLDTVVGERGVTLSGGQKQRVAIARALLAEPRVLVLDDAMASVDALTERDLVSALRAAAAGRTTLVVTQRLSGVLLADRVILLDAGRVADEGTHEELLARSGMYRALFGAQAGTPTPAGAA